jgi:hypothetical protein
MFAQNRVREYLALDCAEVSIHRGTEVRQWTARVYECDGYHPPTPVTERVRSSRLVDQPNIWNQLSRLEDLDARKRRGLGKLRVTGPLDRGYQGIRIFDDEPGFDQVAHGAPLEEVLIEHLERHRHAGHEPADVLMLDRDLLTRRVDGENLTPQLVFMPAGTR